MGDNCAEEKNGESVAKIKECIDKAVLAERLVSNRNPESLEQDWQSSGTDAECLEREIKW